MLFHCNDLHTLNKSLIRLQRVSSCYQIILAIREIKYILLSIYQNYHINILVLTYVDCFRLMILCSIIDILGKLIYILNSKND